MLTILIAGMVAELIMLPVDAVRSDGPRVRREEEGAEPAGVRSGDASTVDGDGSPRMHEPQRPASDRTPDARRSFGRSTSGLTRRGRGLSRLRRAASLSPKLPVQSGRLGLECSHADDSIGAWATRPGHLATASLRCYPLPSPPLEAEGPEILTRTRTLWPTTPRSA